MTKLALITGATGNMGRAIAQRLCKEGFSILLVARTQSKLAKTAGELRINFPQTQIDISCCDISDPIQVKTLFEQLFAQNTRIDVLVNSVGIPGGGVTTEINDELWFNVINTNLNSVFFTIRELLRLKLMPKGGRIINIASTGGKHGAIYGTPYCAAKHGVIGLTKALGLELARCQAGITVNAICPRFVATETAGFVLPHGAEIGDNDPARTQCRREESAPLDHDNEPNEVAAMVSYIASPQANNVTAQTLHVCGGLDND